MNKKLVASLVSCMVLGSVSVYAANPFSDVDASSWAYQSVEQLANAGEFAEGSMKPKVEAAIAFAESKKGRVSIITLLEKSKDGIAGKTGTRIVL